MARRTKAILILLTSIVVSSCGSKRTLEYGNHLFDSKKSQFVELSRIIEKYPALREFPFAPDTRVKIGGNDYGRLLSLMNGVGIEKIRVSKFKGLVEKVYLEDYLLSSWGFLRNTGPIVIVHYFGSARVSRYYRGAICKGLSERYWYVCQLSSWRSNSSSEQMSQLGSNE